MPTYSPTRTLTPVDHLHVETKHHRHQTPPSSPTFTISTGKTKLNINPPPLPLFAFIRIRHGLNNSKSMFSFRSTEVKKCSDRSPKPSLFDSDCTLLLCPSLEIDCRYVCWLAVWWVMVVRWCVMWVALEVMFRLVNRGGDGMAVMEVKGGGIDYGGW
ncbi:unnamed protein product [Lactuca virosa]|uniref:Transmembrane protein n=1 Tax=Lactuca virosa TaxID=75947 RepID=A0AAU9PN87_9ASTR|nr:unnamed protein product [Lactuca virosa]